MDVQTQGVGGLDGGLLKILTEGKQSGVIKEAISAQLMQIFSGTLQDLCGITGNKLQPEKFQQLRRAISDGIRRILGHMKIEPRL